MSLGGPSLRTDPDRQALVEKLLINGLALDPDVGDGASVLVNIDASHHDPALVAGEDFFEIGLGLFAFGRLDFSGTFFLNRNRHRDSGDHPATRSKFPRLQPGGSQWGVSLQV